MNSLINKCRRMIKQAYVSLVSDDSSSYPQVQVSYNGKATNGVRLSPYGLCSNPPTKSLAIVINPNAQDSVSFVISDDMINRFKNLKEGESVLYNSLSQSYVYMKENGDIDIDSKNDINVTIAGKKTITATAGVDIDGGLGNLTGSVCGRSICHFTGLVHADVSADVKVSK